MAKVSPYMLKRPGRVILNPVFKSSDGEVEVPMSLRKLSQMELVSAMDYGNEKTVQYVTGSGMKGQKNYMPPMFLPPVGGEPVYLSASTCQVAALLWRAQTCEDDDRYTFEEIASFMVDDALMEQMTAFVGDLGAEVADSEDPLATSGSASSNTDSTSKLDTTPELSVSD